MKAVWEQGDGVRPRRAQPSAATTPGETGVTTQAHLAIDGVEDLAATSGGSSGSVWGGLVARAQDGCDVSTEALLARVRQLALRYARVRLARFGAEDAAQDVAQEVSMAVFTALPSYAHRGVPFEAFVYGIASRKVADAQRALMRSPQTVPDVPDQVDLTAGPEATALVADEAARALQLVRRLPRQQQEIVTLRVASGLSTEETAAALGMTPGAVRVAQHRALAKLRGFLEAAGPPPEAPQVEVAS